MVSVIDAIINLLNNPAAKLNQEYVNVRNRANNMGEALEEYVKDLFAGTIELDDSSERLERFQEVFSYTGNQNNPPDFMIKGGDAVEVKKIENPNSSLALNSSYPKHKLYSNSPMITNACRECEIWDVKDIIYTVGVVGRGGKSLSALAFVYGEDYAASQEIYERMSAKIKKGVSIIPDVEFNETKELGRVNRVDPLGITYLRIRGMWGIENPFRVFEHLFTRDTDYDFNFMAIINERKWNTLSRTNELKELIGKTEGANLYTAKIKDPDNPVNLRNAYVVTYKV